MGHDTEPAGTMRVWAKRRIPVLREVPVTANLSIRNLDETTKKRLRIRAAENGRSMEAEARTILTTVVDADPGPRENLYDAIRRLVEPIGGVELELPPREPMREPPDFSSENFSP